MPANTQTVVGHTKRFECRVIGHPRPEIRWFKDGRDITRSDRYSFDHNYEGVISMVIEDVHHADEGHYRCRAENSEGFASTSAYLSVKPHAEHPDEEIEEVHAMQLEEHFVYKSKKDHTVFLEYDNNQTEAEVAEKRTFAERVVEEKENVWEGSGMSFCSSVEESTYSSGNIDQHASSIMSIEKVKNTQQVELELASASFAKEEETYEKMTESASPPLESLSEVMNDLDKPLLSVSKSVASSEKTMKENILYVSSSVENNKVKSYVQLEETVETQLSSSSYDRSGKDSVSIMTTNVKEEHLEQRLREEELFTDTTEAEPLSSSLVSGALWSQLETEVPTASQKEQTFIAEEMLEEVPEHCRMQPLDAETSDDYQSKHLTDTGIDSVLTSLCNDSGFLESSLLESSQFEQSADSSALEQLAYYKVPVASTECTPALTEFSAELSTITTTKETVTSDLQPIFAENISEETIVEKVMDRREQTNLSPAFSRVDEVSTNRPVCGDITGLLDEQPDPTTLVAEEQEEAAVIAEDITSRGLWVDQVMTRTEAIMIEGEGKKVDERKGKEPEPSAGEKKQAEVELLQESVPVLRDDNTALNATGSLQAVPLNVTTEHAGESSVDGPGGEKTPAEGQSPPRILVAPDDITVLPGETIRLSSQVQGSPRPEVKWFKAGDTVKSGERITLTMDDDIYMLEINDSQENDAGVYTLTAHNSQGTIFSDVVVTLDIPPSIGLADDEISLTASLMVPEFVMQPENVTVQEFGKLQLVCTIKANPSPNVVWSKEGRSLTSDNHFSIFESEGQFYLEVPRVEPEDGGDYTCTASNSQGSVSCSITVFVERKEKSVSGADGGAAAMVPLSQQESSDERFLHVYEVTRAYHDVDTKHFFIVGDIVEILDSKQKNGMWLVRKQTEREQVCFIPASHMREKGETEPEIIQVKKREKMTRSPTNRLSSTEKDLIDTSEDEDRNRLREKYPDYMVIADYNPAPGSSDGMSEALRLTEGQMVEVMDMERADRWLVQTRPTKTSAARQGWVPPAYLEARMLGAASSRRSTREVFREDVLQIANKQQEAVLKRRYAVTELVESEREYVRDLTKLVESYHKRVGRRSTPAILRDKRDLIFSNVADILDFHNNVFLKILETSVVNPGLIGDAFLVKEKKFSMYATYWTDHLSAKVFVETEEALQFLKEYSRSIGDSEMTLPRLLECPVARLASYQTLLKDILRYTVRAGEECSSLEKAIAMLASLELQVKHSLLLHNIECLPGDVSSMGQLIRHDDVILWKSDTGSTRGKERHLFLFKDKVILTKRKKAEHTTDQQLFVFKGTVELQNVQLNENVPEDERRFELWYASATSEKYTLQTRTLSCKQAWLKDTRELLRALGVEKTDIMPEKVTAVGITQDSTTAIHKKKTSEKVVSTVFDIAESESDQTLTDGDYASLSSLESDISSYHTAPEFEDGTTKPVFKKRPKKTICQEANTVRFDCIVGGTPLPIVRWLKDGQALRESDSVQVTNEGDISVLTLVCVSKLQAGQYSALAANHNGSILAAADLVVLEELTFDKGEQSQEDKTPTEITASAFTFTQESLETQAQLLVQIETAEQRTLDEEHKAREEVPETETVPAPNHAEVVFTQTEEQVKEVPDTLHTESGSAEPLVQEVVLPQKEVLELAENQTSENHLSAHESLTEKVKAVHEIELSEQKKEVEVVYSTILESLTSTRAEQESQENTILIRSVLSEKEFTSETKTTEEDKSSTLIQEKKFIGEVFSETIVSAGEKKVDKSACKSSDVFEPEPVQETTEQAPVEDIVKETFLESEPIVENFEKTFTKKAVDKKLFEAELFVEPIETSATLETAENKVTEEHLVAEPVEHSSVEKAVCEVSDPESVYIAESRAKSASPEDRAVAGDSQLFKKTSEKKVTTPEPVEITEATKSEPVEITDTAKPEPVVITEVTKAEPAKPESIETLETAEPEPVEITEATKQEPVEITKVFKPEPVEITEATKREPVEITKVFKPEPVEITEATKPEPVEITGAAKPEPVEITEATKPEPAKPESIETTEAAKPELVEITGAAKPQPVEITGAAKPEPVEITGAAKPEFVEITEATKPEPAKPESIETTEAAKPEPVETTQATEPKKDQTTQGASKEGFTAPAEDFVSSLGPDSETEECEIPVRVPHFLAEMNDVVVELGQLARFDCRVAAYPDPEITWLKDGRKVVPTDRYLLQNFHDDIFSLLIKEAKTEDSGIYTCLAKNEYGEAKTEALLNVLALTADKEAGDMAPSFVTKFGNVECIEGVPVEFTCQIKGRPPPVITWLLNGREVTPSLEILTRQQEDTIMLAFRSVQLDYSGDVVCKLKNHLGEATCRAKLRVNEDLSKKGECPLFVEQPSNMEVTEGGEAKFECVITGTPEPEVIWYFNGRELFDSRRRIIRKKGDKFQLILKEVIPDNAGVYTCKAVNAAGDASCAVELSVKEIPKVSSKDREEAEFTFPPTFTRRLQDQRVALGQHTRFECLMLGLPLPDVEWQKNGTPLRPSEKVKMGREGSTAILEIDGADLSDTGEYICILTNDSGKATSKASLSVQEEKKVRYTTPRLEGLRVPEVGRAPSRARDDLEPVRPYTEVSKEIVPSLPFDKPSLLEMREDSVKLSWLPARTSNLPENARRIAYIIEARELPSNRWTRLASGVENTNYVARNLHPEKEYMFRVCAENKYGSSDPTLPATLAPREEPKEKRKAYGREESPAAFRFPAAKPYILDIGRETLRLGWKPAEVERHLGLPPVSYRVEAQKLPSEEWVPLASRIRDTSLYLSDLEPDRDYNVRVRAQGPYGITQPTDAVWLPRAAGFTGVPVSRPQITELEPDRVRLQWRRVDVPSFSHEQESLMYMIEMQEPPSTHWREVASRLHDTYYIIQDLEPATDYRFRVRAVNREGLRSEPSPATSVYRTLALTHTPVDRLEIEDYEPDYETVGLSWRRVEIPPFGTDEEPLLYMIECQEPLSDSWRPLVSGIPTTRYRIPDIGPTDDYSFRVRALTPYGMSLPSHATRLYRSPTPSRPLASDLHISNLEPDRLRLAWQPMSIPSSSRATTPLPQPLSYQIEGLEYPSTQWRSLATDVRDTSYQLTGLSPKRDYSFRIRAMMPAGGLTEPTTPVTVTSLPVRPRLPSREPIVREVGPDSVRLEWPRAELPYYVREATPISYSVEMQELPGAQWTPVRRGITDTSYKVTSLRADRDYRFRVRPETQYGPGEYSLPVHAYRKPTVTMPTREPVLYDVGPSSVKLQWTPAALPSGVTSVRPLTYRIEVREPPSGFWIPVAERVPTNSYTISFLNPDKDYSFRVFAELDGAESEPTASAYLPHRMGPPKMLAEPPYITSVHPDSVWLSWRSVDIPARITDYAPVTYRIEAQEPPLSEWRPVARRIPTTHFHLKGLRPAQEYNFRVRAENDIGLSEPTPFVFLRKRSVPPVMKQTEPLISDVQPTSLRLSWRPAEVPSYLLDSVPISYSVYCQQLPDMDWLPLARGVSGTSYFVTGLSPDNNYTFRVQAENQFGISQPSLPVRRPRLAELPAPIYSPEIEEVEPSALRLSWRLPKVGPYKSKKTTYTIETLDPSLWTWRPLVSNLATPSYRVSTLSPLQDYIFRVRAETDKMLSEPSFPISYSRTRAYSHFVERPRKIAPPAVPVERPILSEIEADSVLVNWQPVLYPSLHPGESSRRYRLEMRELPYGSWSTIVPQTTRWSHEVTGLKPAVDYAFRVSCTSDSGLSAPSNPAYLYRRPVIPRVPLELPELSDISDDAVSVRWKRVDIPAYEADEEPLSFMIEAQRLPSYDWEPVARGITDTSYRISGLQPREDYVFRVRGEMPSGVTTPSVSIPLYRRPEKAGVPISYVTVDDRNVPPYSARIRWKPVYIPRYTSPGATLYQIEMRETPQRDWRSVGSDIMGLEHTISDLSPRKTYMFRVRAKSPAGDLSEASIPVPFYPLHMRRYDSSQTQDVGPWNEDFSVPDRPYIHSLIVKVPPRMHIEKPDMYLTSPTSVHLSWHAARVPVATSHLSPTTYRVEVREDGTFSWLEKASNITDLTCDVSGLDPVRDYAFRIRAVNDFGWSEATLPVFLHRPYDLHYDEPEIDWQAFSPSLPPLVAPRLPIDSPRIAPISSDSLRLSWQPARIPAYARKSPITYSVEMKEPVEPAWSTVASNLGQTYHQVTGLDPLRLYLFRVRADSEFGSSDPTLPAELSRVKPTAPHSRSMSVDRQRPPEVDLSRRGSFIDSITTGVPPRVPTGRPTLTSVTETSVTLSWPASRLPAYLKNTKLDYIIESKEGSNRMWTTLAEGVAATTYKATGLDPEQDYMFRVRAHNESGTSEPTLPAMLERPKQASTPHRRGSSVERRSQEGRSVDHMGERRSSSRTSLDRGRREGRAKGGEEETLPGQTPDDSPQAPQFSQLDSEDVQYGVESHPMTVCLQLRGYPPPQVSWYHNGKKLELGERYDTYVTPKGQVFLEFLNMGWQDVGDYKCVAENDLGTAEKSIRVDVADPPTFIEPLQDVRIADKGKGLLMCAVDGIPYPTVRFMKDWHPLADTSRLVVTHDPQNSEQWTLSISDVIPADSGSYMCVAENVAGKVFSTCRVTVDEFTKDVPLDYKDGCLEDNYYVLQELGRGRYGRVRRVIEKSTGKEYAAKFIQVRDAVDKEFFRSELDMLLRQTSKNIVSVHDAYETPRQLIIVMELLSGGELLDQVVSHGIWTEGQAAGVIKQLLQTLKDVHALGVVHMDIKPSELILSGESLDTAKLVDFGLARKLSPSQETLLNHGTPEFVSPEVVHVKAISPSTDIWGVGVLAFILLGGRSPFEADSAEESLKKAEMCQWSFSDSPSFSNVSKEGLDFITKILKKNPEDRPSLGDCLSHPWLKTVEGGANIDVSLIRAFQERDKQQRQAKAVKTVASLYTLKRLINAEKQDGGLRPALDPKTGIVSFPDAEAYGEFFDSESWYEWQARYGQGPDSGLLPLKDPEYTSRIRGYKRAAGSVDEPSKDDETTGAERERYKMMKERRLMADIDKEEIPPSLKMELQWREERKQARTGREPQKQDSVDSRRSSIAEGDGAGGPVPMFRQRLQDLTFETGDNITMYCALEGPPPYSTVWYRNDELLADGSRVKQELSEDGQATLTITSAKPYDAGVYKCVARSKAGRASTKMRLLLGDVPERPGRPVVVQVAAQELVLIWEAPRFDGNCPVLYYRVDYKTRGGRHWSTATYTPLETCLVTDLKPETAYRLRVSATNILGRGPFSWSSAEVTTDKQGSVTALTTGDVNLEFVRKRQEEGQESARKVQEVELPVEGDSAVDTALTLQAGEPDKDFALGEVICRGRFGELREGTNKKTSRRCLVKVVDSAGAETEQEFNILKTLCHERVLRLLSAFFTKSQFYFIFEEASGEHVAQRLSLRRRYSEDNVAYIIRQLLYALQFLHQNSVIHLNLQPASLMLTSRPGLDIKLTDFALAQTVANGSEEVAVPCKGYPDFIAPEVVVRKRAARASDVWGVGTLTFLLLSGLSPFRGGSDEETLINVAYSRYDAGDLLDGVSSEALKFLYKVMRLLPRNRPTIQECLEHKWLQLTDIMMKTREGNLFRSNRLRQFVLTYDLCRQKDDLHILFDDLVLSSELMDSLHLDIQSADAQKEQKDTESVEMDQEMLSVRASPDKQAAEAEEMKQPAHALEGESSIDQPRKSSKEAAGSAETDASVPKQTADNAKVDKSAQIAIDMKSISTDTPHKEDDIEVTSTILEDALSTLQKAEFFKAEDDAKYSLIDAKLQTADEIGRQEEMTASRSYVTKAEELKEKTKSAEEEEQESKEKAAEVSVVRSQHEKVPSLAEKEQVASKTTEEEPTKTSLEPVKPQEVVATNTQDTMLEGTPAAEPMD